MFIIFLVVSVTVGYVGVRFLDRQAGLRGLTLLVTSLMLGTTIVGYLVLLTSVIAGDMLLASGIIGAGLLPAGLIVFLRSGVGWRDTLKDDCISVKYNFRVSFRTIIFIGGLLALFFVVSMQSMLWNQEGLPSSILKGWGDGAYHLSMVQHMVQARPFSLEQPILSGRILTYPFFVNFLTALLIRLGAPIAWAWHIPTIIFGLGLLFLARAWARLFLNREVYSYLFVALILCGAGLGFLWLVKNIGYDATAVGLSESLSKNIFNPVFEYSHLDVRTGGKLAEGLYPANITWVVPLISFFSHQRSFMLGAAMGFLLLYGLARYQQDRTWPRWLMLFSLLPLMHLHTFIALGLWIGVWAVGQIVIFRMWREKQFLIWTTVAVLLTMPVVIWLGSGVLGDAGGQSFFLRPWLGWTMCTHQASWWQCDPGVTDITRNILWFWLKNFGLIWIGWCVALWWFMRRGRGESPVKQMIAPSLLLFVLPNLVLFQPWEFDNNKVLFWWWVLAALFSLALFQELSERFVSRRSILAVVFGLFCLGTLASGGFDIMKRASHGFSVIANKTSYSYYGQYGLAVGQMIKERTLPDDVILTNQSPNNPVVLVGGRQLYLGYPGWLWTQGKWGSIAGRKKVVADFLATGDTDKLCSGGVAYWAVDDQFGRDYPTTATETVWRHTEFIDAVRQGDSRTELRKIICRLP